MKVKLIIISIILLLVMVFACGCSQFMENIGLINPTNEEQLSPEKASSDGFVKVLIGFKEKPGPAEQALVKGEGGKINYTYHLIPAIAASVPEVTIEVLRKNPNITHVDLDGEIFAIDQALPWGVDRIDAEVVHTSGNKGAGVNVAILDTGIDLDHSDLSVVGGANFVSGKSYDDKNGHGTHVAGIVAALDNEIGVIGVAPEVELYAVKVLGNGGIGWWSDLIAGLQWCVDEGMDVANMSLGATSAPDDVKTACDSAYTAGVLLVAAAGNEYGGSVIYPAAYDSVIAVSATDDTDNLATFSSTGEEVELAAPGADIYSTYKDGGYATMSGTSMASPHVAGTAALVIAAGIVDDVRDQLQITAEDLGDSGKDVIYGYGLVDAENAVLGTTEGDNLPPPAAGTIAGNVTDASTSSAIEGATVVVEGTNLSAITDTNGDYTITDVAEGTYTVTASADGYENASQEVTVSADTTSTANFALSPSATGKMYVESIIFTSKVAGSNKFLYTTVEVVNSDGIALEGVRVEMTLEWDKDNDGTIDDSWNFAGDTGTDGTVKFTLLKAQSGYYTAIVTNLILTDYTWDTTKGVTSASCKLNDDGTITQ